MTKNYIIRLTPIETFYFGGENSFNSIEGESNYFVKSNLFPQQTGLLGLTRYLTLKIHNKLNLPPNDTKSLIGPYGFPKDISKINKEQNYGGIKSISPVFLQAENGDGVLSNYLPAARDYTIITEPESMPKAEDIKYLNLNNEQIHSKLAGTSTQNRRMFESYKAKNGIAEILVNANGIDWKYYESVKELSTSSINGMYIKQEQVGIQKPSVFKRDGTRVGAKSKKNDAFYKKVSYRFNGGFGFAFFAEMDEAARIEDANGSLTTFGGEKSMFRVSVIDAKSNNFKTLFSTVNSLLAPDRQGQLILLSDAYILQNRIDEFFNCVSYSSNQSKDFRYIKTAETGGRINYAAMHSKDDTGLSKADKFNLLERGSVFYFNDNANIETLEEILRNPVFGQIGYNYYQIFKHNQL